MPFIHSDSTATDVSASAPQATNYIDMLHKLVAFATSTGVATVAVNAAGSGYAVGDIVEIDNGSHPTLLAGTKATIEVTAVTGGAVDTVRIIDTGAYSSNPTATGETTTALSGSGTGLTVNLTFNTAPWSILRQTQEAASATISAGGTGYSVGDDVEILGGDTRVGFDNPQTDTPASFNVDSESSGVVTAVSLIDGGTYHRVPSNPADTTVLTGSGNADLTLTVTYSNVVDTTTDVEYWLQSASGSAIVGLRSFSNGTTVFNWELAMAAAYNASADWDAQTQMSVGRYPLDETGSYCILRDVAFNYYARVTDRYIVCKFNIDNGVYSNIWIGLFNPYGTTNEYSYPALILGCSSRHSNTVTTVDEAWVGLNAAIATANGDNGPAQFYTPGGSWVPFSNGYRSGNDILGDEDQYHLFPGGNFFTTSALIADGDDFIRNDSNSQKQDWGSFASIATATGADGEDEPTETFRPTPTTGNDQLYLAEIILCGITPLILAAGEVPGIRWVDRTLNVGVLNAEDRTTDSSGNIYFIFNNCSMTDRQFWCALQAGA